MCRGSVFWICRGSGGCMGVWRLCVECVVGVCRVCFGCVEVVVDVWVCGGGV